jgi:RimJ/RimL family protein N-acetyltransferase
VEINFQPSPKTKKPLSCERFFNLKRVGGGGNRTRSDDRIKNSGPPGRIALGLFMKPFRIPKNKVLRVSTRRAFMLTLRPAVAEDAAAVWGLLEDYRGVFLEDYKSLNQAVVLEGIAGGEVYVVEAADTAGAYPVGLVAFTDRFEDLYLSIHFLLRPAYLLPFIREKHAMAALDLGFKGYGVKKIKARVLDSQKMAVKLAQRLGFKQRGFFPRETRKGGQYVAIRIFELTKNDWKQCKRRLCMPQADPTRIRTASLTAQPTTAPSPYPGEGI